MHVHILMNCAVQKRHLHIKLAELLPLWSSNCKHSTNCGTACHRAEGLNIINPCLLHMSFRDQASTKPLSQTIGIQLRSKHPAIVDDLHILQTINQLPRVIFHQCIHFFLHGPNPFLLLCGFHSFLVWHWISTTSNSSVCWQKNVFPWCHSHWPLYRAYWSLRVPGKLFSVPTLRVLSDCNDSNTVSPSGLFSRTTSSTSASSNPISTTELVQTRSGLK